MPSKRLGKMRGGVREQSTGRRACDQFSAAAAVRHHHKDGRGLGGGSGSAASPAQLVSTTRSGTGKPLMNLLFLVLMLQVVRK